MLLKLIPYLINLRRLKKNQWLSIPEIKKLQEKKLNAVLRHAYYNVDYYRNLFDQAGIQPDDVNCLHDIPKIPITSRKQIQSISREEIISTDINLAHCLKLRTSGSTGMPLDIFISEREIMSRWLSYRRIYFENGGRLQDRTLVIITPQNIGSGGQWFNKLGILKRKYLSIFDDIESQLKIILEFKPDVIESYPSVIRNLAIEIKKKKIKNINPRIIFTTAELMTRQDREFINSVFQAELIHYYASNECGIIAWECRQHCGYHLNSDNIIVEFLKKDGTISDYGEEGEIVVTSLYSYAMPFIRYRIGDVGIPTNEKCSCGIELPLIKIIAGRYNDQIVLPNGNMVSAYSLTNTLEHFKEVSHYQIIQEKKDMIKVNIVKKEGLSSGAIIKIKENFKNILGENIEIVINEVGEILKEGSGKFKVFKSQVK